MTNNITRDHIIADLSSELVELKRGLRDAVNSLRNRAQECLVEREVCGASNSHEAGFSEGWDVGYARGLQGAASDLEGWLGL